MTITPARAPIDEPAEVAAPGYVGRSVPRVEDPRLLTGRGRFVDDVELPDMLHAAIARSPHPHARIVSIDASRARELNGVVRVITGAELAEHVKPFISELGREEVRTLKREILAVDRVRHVGDGFAIVVAESRYIAEDGCDLLDVEWELLPAVTDVEAAMAPDAPVLDPDAPGNLIARMALENGDVGAAFRDADHVFRKRLRSQRYLGAPIENDGVVAHYDAALDELTVWCTSQMPHPAQAFVADVLGMRANQVRFIAQDMGGGFGYRARISTEEAAIPAVARLMGRPVKWIADRYEALSSGVHAKEIVTDLAIAVRDGRLSAIQADFVQNAGAYSLFPYTSLVDAVSAPTSLTGLYKFDAASYVTRSVLTNKSWTGPYRGVGWGISQLVREVLVDEVARALEEDPVEFRLRHMLEDGEHYQSLSGFRYDGGSYKSALRRAQELLGHDEQRARQHEQRELRGDDDPLLGLGYSPYAEPTGWSAEIGKAQGYPSDYYDSATIEIEPDGSVLVTTGAQNHGQGHETTMAQVAADALGANFADVRVVEGDTSRSAWGMGTWGSRSAQLYGGAIMRAGRTVRAKVVAVAAHILGCQEASVVIRESEAWAADAPDERITLAEIAAFAYFGTPMAGHSGSMSGRPPELESPLVAAASYSSPESFGNGAIGALVSVDVGTGVITIERLVHLEDCGTILNPTIVEGQLTGALAQAVGASLFEELSYSEAGGFLSPTLQDYLLPTSLDMPALSFGHIVSASQTEGGIKGLGEGGMIGGPAAIACAVADALVPLGIAVDRMPLDPGNVLDMLAGRAVGVH